MASRVTTVSIFLCPSPNPFAELMFSNLLKLQKIIRSSWTDPSSLSLKMIGLSQSRDPFCDISKQTKKKANILIEGKMIYDGYYPSNLNILERESLYSSYFKFLNG